MNTGGCSSSTSVVNPLQTSLTFTAQSNRRPHRRTAASCRRNCRQSWITIGSKLVRCRQPVRLSQLVIQGGQRRSCAEGEFHIGGIVFQRFVPGNGKNLTEGKDGRGGLDRDRLLGDAAQQSGDLGQRKAPASFRREQSVGYFQWPDRRRQGLGAMRKQIQHVVGKASFRPRNTRLPPQTRPARIA